MKELKKAELKSETWQICEILLLAQSSFRITEYLLRSDSQDEASYIGQSFYFQYSIRINWRTTVIELSKLFAERDRYNLRNFINKLKKDGHFGDASISAEKIEVWENQLHEESKAINNLILQRDKLYAHTDSAHKTVINTVTLKKTNELIEIAQKIIKAIYLTVFESGMCFDPIGDPVQNLKYIIDTLVNERAERLAPLIELAKKQGIDNP